MNQWHFRRNGQCPGEEDQVFCSVCWGNYCNGEYDVNPTKSPDLMLKILITSHYILYMYPATKIGINKCNNAKYVNHNIHSKILL